MNPIYGSVGLLWSGSWQLCQAAVEAVLKGAPITPINSEVAANGRGPPLKAYDIRHVSKDENNAAANAAEPQRVRTRSRFKRSAGAVKPKEDNRTGFVPDEPEAAANRSDHESSLSHQSEAANAVVMTAALEGESKESESDVSVETSVLFHDEPESEAKGSGRAEECGDVVGLELTLGFEPVSRAHHVVPVKKRRIELKDFCGGVSGESGSCKIELGLQYQALNGSVLT